MKIYTDLVENKKYSCPIQADLLKYSQEYRVLATLRYLFPGRYETMAMGESPDLQDCINGLGIEVTAAVRENDMKASRAFSKLCQERNNQAAKKYNGIIESSGYSLKSLPWGQLSISTIGTSDGEKKCFQNSIRKKKTKLEKYRAKFDLLGLSVLLLDNPTSEAEKHFGDWIREVFQEDNKLFDFVYVISHRFCIYYEGQSGFVQKWNISGVEDYLLRIIARMTAEGELSLEDQEWQ